MFTKALATSVGARIRSNGTYYYRSGAVLELTGTDWVVNGTVRGTRDYRVEVVRDQDRFTASCECPYYADRSEICKHIWAALLEAEARQLLGGDGIVEDDAILEPEYRPPDEPAIMPGITYPAAIGKPQALPPWQRFLRELQQDVAAAERSVPQPRFANGQIIYAIDARETLGGHGTAIHVLFRQRKRNGEWGKPKGAAVTAREADHLADPDDCEILSLLMGAANPSTFPVDSAYEYGRPSRFYLSGVLEERLLPMLARTGRAHLATGGPDRELLPLTWDDGSPWRFDLQIGIDETADGVRIDGAFVRDHERLTLAEPALLLSGGFLFTRSSVARLDLYGGFAWIARLRRYRADAHPARRDRTAAGNTGAIRHGSARAA